MNHTGSVIATLIFFSTLNQQCCSISKVTITSFVYFDGNVYTRVTKVDILLKLLAVLEAVVDAVVDTFCVFVVDIAILQYKNHNNEFSTNSVKDKPRDFGDFSLQWLIVVMNIIRSIDLLLTLMYQITFDILNVVYFYSPLYKSF